MASARSGSRFAFGSQRASCAGSPRWRHRTHGDADHAVAFESLMLRRIRHLFRVFARSGSWRFARDVGQARTLARSGVRGLPLAKLNWRGRDVFYRPATSDPLAIYQVLVRSRGKAEYYLPPRLQPNVILDIG